MLQDVKPFKKLMAEGIKLLRCVKIVDLSKEVTIAEWLPRYAVIGCNEWHQFYGCSMIVP